MIPAETAFDGRPANGTVEFLASSFAESPTQWQIASLLCKLEPLEHAAYRTQGRVRLHGSAVRVIE